MLNSFKEIIFSTFDQSSGVFRQVRIDYLCADHAALDQDVAVQLCCLEIRHFFKDMPQIALDKKSNLEYLEKEVIL
jgi:focal adhesion kinase 1